ncbi:MAG: metallophosphoesterase [Thalassolituus sp.]
MSATSMPVWAVLCASLVFSACGGGSSSSDSSNPLSSPAGQDLAQFRVLPYVQNPSDDAITIIWFTEEDLTGELVVRNVGTFASEPVLASALTYGQVEVDYIHSENNLGAIHAGVEAAQAPSLPYKHVVRVDGLEPSTTYQYSVPVADQEFVAEFTTAPAAGARQAVRFLAMSDMETEPESTGKTVPWSANGLDKLSTDPDTYNRQYLVDQTTGFQANLRYAKERTPDFWIIAGDLVEKGGRQLDWDEFWRHAAGEWNTLASQTPIFPVMGNHENYWHPDGGSYTQEAAMLAYDKFSTYWELPANQGSDQRYAKRYYRVDYGPVTLISLDSSNGDDSDPAKDTNLMLDGSAARIPDFNRFSEQWNWAVRELADAQAKGQVIFAQFHHSAFGTGVHSLPSGDAGIDNNEDNQSGVPMRVYHDLFSSYGVVAVLAGHDELLEYTSLDGVHYWDVGFAGDGLRGPGYPPTTTYVPVDLLPEEAQANHWSVHGDVPESWNGDQLIDGGKHYGFLEVEVRPVAEHDFEVVMTPRYAFPVSDASGAFTGEFDFRQYNKVVRIPVQR